MKIVVSKPKVVKPITIQQFSDRHGFVMVVDRPSKPGGCWSAHFQDWPEVKDGIVLTSKSGYGSTLKKAISNYAHEISGQLLVFHAYGENRLEIRVPVLK